MQTGSNMAGLLGKAMAQKLPVLPTMTTVVVVIHPHYSSTGTTLPLPYLFKHHQSKK
jgi:hypothetical protein